MSSKIIYQCGVCEMQFSNSLALFKHRKSHDKEESVKCDQCEKSLASKVRLKVHMKNVHEKNS